MPDYLDTLAQDAKQTVAEGYYNVSTQHNSVLVSLKEAIKESKTNAIITEVKAASPSRGTIKTNVDPAEIASAMEKGGSIGISVLTEPKHFNGALSYLAKVREAVKLPILMKDIIVDPIQLEAATRIGANIVLLIEAVFERGYCEFSVDEMITQAHSRSLEVLLETHNEDEFLRAIETNADLVGINNRDLRTLKIDLETTKAILKKHEKRGKVVVSESGIMTVTDLVFLRNCGAQAFLIGSAIMMSDNIEQKVKEFVTAH
ncbi:MAG: indole-3-glycerol-phosphate synthase [Candidatus Bathyarchaeota archaeon]|nr:indole-3-glycerol-phosphate synthase [Candidatus Bathyarchaeum sp.]